MTLSKSLPLPPWLSFNPISNTIAGHPPTFTSKRKLDFYLYAHDTKSSSAFQVITLIVTPNLPPTLLQDVPIIEAISGKEVVYQIPIKTFDKGGLLDYELATRDFTWL